MLLLAGRPSPQSSRLLALLPALHPARESCRAETLRLYALPYPVPSAPLHCIARLPMLLPAL